MKRVPPDSRHGIATLRLAFALCAAALVPLMVYAGAPSWWSQRGVINPNATANDFATANQGQLKNIAKAAGAEMDAHLPGGAGTVVHSLIASWSQSNAQTNNLAPLNLGQLKTIAKPFYDRLIATGYASDYPWANQPNPPNDFAVANVGQVKKLFAFDLRAVDPIHDADQNSLPDWWERFYFGNIGNDPNAPAPRGDGLTILQALQANLNPIDFYDGALPTLQKTSGDSQTGRTSEVLLLPLRVRVTDSAGAALANAPVTFAGEPDGATLALFAGGPFSSSLTVRADANGIARASVRLPATAGLVNIAATAGAGSNSQRVSFTAMVQNRVAQISPPPYEVRSLPPNAPPYNVRFEMNSMGVVAGTGTDQLSSSFVPRRSFLWNPVSGSYTELGFLPGSNSTEALGLNDAGDVVGDATDANGNDQGFLWSNGTLQALVAPGAQYTYPYAINAARQVVGTSYDANWNSQGFIWKDGVFTTIAIPNSNGTIVEDINESGQVLGSYYDENWNQQAFLWRDGVVTPISIPGSVSVDYYVFNDAGQVAGVYRGQNFWNYGFLWENGVATTITLGGFRTTVYGINAAGQVIGSSALPGTSVEQAFVWQNGQITQLMSFPGAAPNQFSAATSINDEGVIMGRSPTPVAIDALVLWQDGKIWKLTDCMPAYQHPDPATSAYFDIGNSYDITGRRVVLHRLPDSDGDGLPDAWETQYGLDPLSPADAAVDTDGDGLTNYQEYQGGTDPTSPDSDADGIPDGWEAAHGYDPRSNADAQLDEDHDGLTTLQEYQNGTEPRGVFTVRDIGNSDSAWMFASALNANGEVMGIRGDLAGNARGFFWHDGAVEDITPPGANSIELFSLNDLAQTVGRYRDSGNVLHTFLWQSGVATDLPFPTLYSTSSPFFRPQINNQGQIMGTYVDANQKPHGFLWHDGALEDIAPTAPWSYVLSLNNSGVVLGATFDSNGTGHGFVWQGGAMTALPQYPDRGALNDAADAAVGYREAITSIPRVATVLNGIFNPLGTANVGELVQGRAINASGHVLIRNTNDPGIWRDGQLSRVSALNGIWAYPQAFNDSDVVVGESTAPSGATHAFVSRANHTTDLNYLVPQGSGLEFTSAVAINNTGQILVKAVWNGWNHAVLLTPNNDTDSNGLPDDWEKLYFGQTGTDPNADADGDGVTNSQEFVNRTNPIDYYNGQTPTLVIVSGNNQVAPPNAFLPSPFVVKVTDSAGNPLANAPVTFAATDGGGALAANRQPPTSSSFAARTAADGTATAYYLQPAAADVTSHITASAGPTTSPATVVFATTSASGTGVQVTPATISRTLNPGTFVTIPIQITNYTDTPQQFTAAVTGVPLPSYTDSRQENGPQFVWNDISGTGTHLNVVSDTDDAFEAFDIGFEFPFFGTTYHTVYVGANGYVTFGAGSTRFMSRALPDYLMAPNLVAAFARDLNTRTSGDVYYQEQADGVIVQFTNVGYYGTAGTVTFQIVLKHDGTILFYYADLTGPVNQATVGVQNETRDVGLTVVSNSDYLTSNMAVRIDGAQRRQVLTTAPAGTAYNGTYTDSDQADGPAYIWDDISTTGTRLAYISNSDDSTQPIYFNFAFPFYETNYQSVSVSSNGFVTLGNASSGGGHTILPGWGSPPSVIAALMTDLDPSVSGDIYYQESAGQLIIQYNNVALYGGGGFVTFQIVLQQDGGILFYYKDLSGGFTQSTVGIQDSTQTKGLTVAYDQPYLKNNLAVRINQLSRWLSVDPQTGTVPTGTTVTLNAQVDARFMTGGTYDAQIHIGTSGDSERAFDVPVSLRVNTAPDVYLTAPGYWTTFLEGEPVTLAADAQDIDGIAKVEFYDGPTKLGEATLAPFAITTADLGPGVHWVSARAYDALGMSKTSDSIPIDIHGDSDHDGLDDSWETRYFGNLDQGPNDDPDQDGLTNLTEFEEGFDPTWRDDSDEDGLPDGYEISIYHTDRWNPDTDGDGMPDGFEVAHGLNPLHDDRLGDPDGDGLTNIEEFILGTDPTKFSTVDDGISDGWKVSYGLDPLNPTLADLVLGIGKTVREAYTLGIDPRNWDANGDGVPDNISSSLGIDPLNFDQDGDGIPNAVELAMGTNPFKADTDGDGVPDNVDAFPLDPTRWELTPVSGDTTPPGITLLEPIGATPVP